MEILYISNSCSERKYKEVYEMRKVKAIEPQQKFNWLLASGIAEVNEVHVTALCGLPVSHSTCEQKRFEHESETISDGLQYEYIAFRNGKITRLLDFYLNSKKFIGKWAHEQKGKQCCIIVDVLGPFLIMGGFSIAKKYGIPVIGVVTDLPELSTKMKERKESFIKKIGLLLFQKLNTKTLKKYDGFVSLTQSINEVVNPKGLKPEVVVEGSVDDRVEYIASEQQEPPVVVYAGGVYAKYGLKNLVDAFSGLTIDAELHVYGDGSYVEEIEKIKSSHPNIKYMGMASLEEIVKIERQASLLVNPRPSTEEFSKYSFPSKTLEYMASGTPLLSTRLPGIPKEYFDYIFSIENESIDGMRTALESILMLTEEERREKGRDAYEFVTEQKTNVKQGERIINFIKDSFYA